MNVTLQTNRLNTYNNNKQSKNINKASYPAFTANTFQVLPPKSNIFKPFANAYDSLTEFLAKKMVAPLMDSKFAKFYAEKTKNWDMLNHINAAGSVIISGMYMHKTLTNKQMDNDRKKILALNQGLTLVLSTTGAYLLDKKLDNLWSKVTLKFAAVKSGDKNLVDAVKSKTKFGNIQKYVSQTLKNEHLAKQIGAMSIAKKLFVFSMVYRYITPVVVTPIANYFGEKVLAKKKAKLAAAGVKPEFGGAKAAAN